MHVALRSLDSMEYLQEETTVHLTGQGSTYNDLSILDRYKYSRGKDSHENRSLDLISISIPMMIIGESGRSGFHTHLDKLGSILPAYLFRKTF